MQNNLFLYLCGASENILKKNIIISPVLTNKTLNNIFGASVFKSKGALYTIYNYTINKKEFTVIKTPMGANWIGDIILMLKQKYNNIFFIGAAGSLIENQIGNIYLVNKAYNLESFSNLINHKITLDNNFYSLDEKSLNNFRKNILNKFPETSIGDFVSISSLYLQNNKTLMNYFKNQKITGLEMETSAFYAANKYKKNKSMAFVFISDIINKLNFYETFNNKIYKEKFNISIKKIFDIIISIIE